MEDTKMCLWVNQQTCKFSNFMNITSESTFYNDYCTFCLKGKLINEISNMNRKIDQMLILMRK